MTEEDRVEQWHQLHKWPPTWQPESEGWKNLMETREKELLKLKGSDERWENWLQYTQSRYVRTFTPDGYKVAQVPPAVFKKLQDAVNRDLAHFDTLHEEQRIDAIFYGEQDLLPKFVRLQIDS